MGDAERDDPWRPPSHIDDPSPPAPAGPLAPPAGRPAADAPPPGDGSDDRSPWAPSADETDSSPWFAGPTRPRRTSPPVVLDDDPAPRWTFAAGTTTDRTTTAETTTAETTTDRTPADDTVAGRMRIDQAARDLAGPGATTTDDAAAGPTGPGETPVDEAVARSGRRLVPVGVTVALLLVAVGVVRIVAGGGNDPADGARLPDAIDERWEVPLGERFVLDAAITDEAVVATTSRPGLGGVELASYDVDDGALLWSRPLNAVANRLDVVSGDLVVVSVVEEFAGGRSSFALDAVTGETVWEREEDGVVFTRPSMGTLGLADTGRFAPIQPAFGLVDLATGRSVAGFDGDLVGLRADGGLVTIDDEGEVAIVDLTTHDPDDPDPGVEATVVATTSPDRGNAFELAGRWFSPVDGGLVEIGFAADAPRVLLDRRDDEQRSPLPEIEASDFFAPVDERRAVRLGIDGVYGVELVGDELRVTWSAGGSVGLPRPADGGRVVLDVVRDRDDARLVRRDPFLAVPSLVVDAATGETLAEFDGLPLRPGVLPVDGTLAWSDAVGGATSESNDFSATLAAVGLDGSERWRYDAVAAGPFLGERELVVMRRDGDTSRLVFLDEGPRAREPD